MFHEQIKEKIQRNAVLNYPSLLGIKKKYCSHYLFNCLFVHPYVLFSSSFIASIHSLIFLSALYVHFFHSVLPFTGGCDRPFICLFFSCTINGEQRKDLVGFKTEYYYVHFAELK